MHLTHYLINMSVTAITYIEEKLLHYLEFIKLYAIIPEVIALIMPHTDVVISCM
jgi:hypothetical protein